MVIQRLQADGAMSTNGGHDQNSRQLLYNVEISRGFLALRAFNGNS
jgi:hypothetical protein